MSQPRLPKPPQPRRGAESNAGTFLALFFLLLAGGSFLLLVGIVTGTALFFIIPLILIGGTLFGMFHYLVWGRLLSKLMAHDPDDETFE